MNSLNVALLGYGLAGKVFHAPLVSSVPGLRLAAVVSRDAAKVRHDLPEVDVLPSADLAIASREFDLIVIATPNDTHFDLAKRALNAGKHVVVDKPFTITLAEAEALTDLARSSGHMLSVFQSRRWDGDFLTLRRIVASGELGDIVHFESHYDRYRPIVRQRWKEQAGPGSGIWYDLGPHVADQALQLFGPPEAIFADLAMQREGSQAVDYFHVLLRYPGLRVVLHASNLVAEPTPRFELHGTRGSYVKQGMDVQEDQSRRGMRPGDAGWGEDSQDGVVILRPDEAAEAHAVPTEPGQYQAFYAAVRDAIAGRGPNPVPPEDGVAVMRILELGSRSAAERRELLYPSGSPSYQ